MTMILFVFFMVAERASACGSAIGEMIPGNKVVGFQLKASGIFGAKAGGEAEWAMDDDGIMVLSLVASHCYADVPRVEVKVTDAQKQCADDAQKELDYDKKIRFDWFSPKYKNLTQSQDALTAKCGLDALKLWSDAIRVADELPLPCAKDVRGIVKKAVSRNAEYLKEQTSPKVLAGLSPAQRAETIAILNADQAHGLKLVEMFNSTPVKMGDFKAWADGLEKVIKPHEYQVVASPDDKFDPGKQKPLSGILSSLGSPLPFMMRSKCGPAFPKDLVNVLQNVIWEPRGSGPGTQGGQGVKR